jgi:hypothetical protein
MKKVIVASAVLAALCMPGLADGNKTAGITPITRTMAATEATRALYLVRS